MQSAAALSFQAVTSGWSLANTAIALDISLGAPLVYRKTAKGQEEIASRAHRLPPQLRGPLVMVDGKRSEVDLAALWPRAFEVLRTLAELGFTEVVNHSADHRARSRPLAPPAPLDEAPDAATVAATAAAAEAAAAATEFRTRRRQALRNFNDLVGPAGESLSLKIDKTQSLAEMRRHFPQMIHLVGMLRGRREAEALSALLDAL